MRYYRPAIFIYIALLLPGCAAVSSYVDQGMQMTKEAVDKAAAVEKRVPCLIRLGAKVRMPSAEKQVLDAYVEAMCH